MEKTKPPNLSDSNFRTDITQYRVHLTKYSFIKGRQSSDNIRLLVAILEVPSKTLDSALDADKT